MILPNHIAFIMDGNGRWAQQREQKRIAGHYAGAQRLKELIEYLVSKKIQYASFFAFGIDNWKRPKTEVTYIWNLIRRTLTKKSLEWFMKHNVKFQWIGFRSDLIDQDIIDILMQANEQTKNNTGTVINLFMNYSGRADILHAAQQMKNQKSWTHEEFDKHLLTSNLPDVDLLIRSGGEQRLSDFMLWQISYSEIIFSPVLWPDFDKQQLDECLKIFSLRDRRFGGLKNANN